LGFVGNTKPARGWEKSQLGEICRIEKSKNNHFFVFWAFADGGFGGWYYGRENPTKKKEKIVNTPNTQVVVSMAKTA